MSLFTANALSADYSGITKALDNIGGMEMLIFGIRTAMLFAGVIIIWRAVLILWEMRPIRKKRYAKTVDAEVIEITEEHRSATLNVYYLPRLEYTDENGDVKVFAPNAYRPCRLKYGDSVTLCLPNEQRKGRKKKEKFRTIRKSLSVKKALIMLAVGIVLVVLQVV